MRARLAIAIGAARQHQDDLRFLVEVDRRRASIGVHAATDPTRPARASTSLWLDVDQAERLGQDILNAVAAARGPDVVFARAEAAVAMPLLAGAP